MKKQKLILEQIDRKILQLKINEELTIHSTGWIKNRTYNPDEIAIRFSHRLLLIHVFPNGNGRHSRLVADILISRLFKRQPFSWGGSDLSNSGQIRKIYLEAVYAADKGDIKPLIVFSRL